MPDRRYDVVLIGAGVIGSAIAWRLSQQRLRVLWLEAADDVCEGASKANSAIACSGFDVPPGTLESQLVVASSPRWEQLCASLDVPFKRIGGLVLSFDEGSEALAGLTADASRNGVATEILDADDARSMVPGLSPALTGALHAPAEGIIDPMRLTLGFARQAVRAGVELLLRTPITGVSRDGLNRITHVRTPRGSFATRAVVDAAGLAAGSVAELAGDDSLRVWPRRGQFLVIDREVGLTVGKILAPAPSPKGRGVLVVPTTNGSLLVGPTAEDIEQPGDTETSAEQLESVFARARTLLPKLSPQNVMKSFAGLRPATEDGYRVAVSAQVPNLVFAAGIRSTGVSSSPAVAELVHTLLVEELGLSAPARSDLPAVRPVRRIAELESAEAVALAERDPRYRMIVCACEHVSAAEIDDALSGPIPACSIDAVRKRTRATGGRCQGAYCAAGVGFMLSVARDLEPWAVPQSGAQADATWGVPR